MRITRLKGDKRRGGGCVQFKQKNGILLTLQLSFPNAFLAGLISRHDELDEERKAGCSKINKKVSFSSLSVIKLCKRN